MDIELKNKEKVKITVMKNNDLYEYYVSGVKIGVFDPKKMYDNILVLQNTLENEIMSQIKDEINFMDRGQIQEEAERNEKIKEYAEEMGIENINDIHIIDLEDEEKDEKDGEEQEKVEEEQEEEKKDEKAKANQFNIKQEIDLSERADDMHDLKKWLGGNIPSDFTKIAVIESDQMSDFKNEDGKSYTADSTRYSLAIIDKDNNIEPLQKYIPSLQQRSSGGNNPREEKYQVDKDGNVEKDVVLSEYEIGDKIIQIDNKEMGRVELNIGKEEHGGNETIGVQMRDSNSTFTTSKETRGVMGEYESNGEYTVDENLKEVKQHEDCEKLTDKDIDGDSETKSHEHESEEYVVDEDGKKYTYSELATRWGFVKDGKPDAEYAKEKYESIKDDEKSVKEAIEEADERFEDPRLKDSRM